MNTQYKNFSVNKVYLRTKTLSIILLIQLCLIGLLFSTTSCKKESTTVSNDGFPSGTCRINKIDKDVVSYNSDGRLKSLGVIAYSYSGQSVYLTDNTIDSNILELILNGNGTVNTAKTYELKATDPYSISYYTYNADGTLKYSNEYLNLNNKLFLTGKLVYTWKGGNLTQINGYNSTDTVSVPAYIFKIIYDTTLIEPRKSFFDKSYLNYPIYGANVVYGTPSKNLPSAIQEIDGSTNTYNKVVYLFDSKKNITKETYQTNAGVERWYRQFAYECK